MRYLSIYEKLIQKGQIRIGVEGYFENHHIKPRCLGGSDEKQNMVKLTAKEHFTAHRLLCKIHPESKGLRYALACMTGRGVRSNSRAYATIREGVSKARKGVEFSQEHKDKLAARKLGTIRGTPSEHTRIKMSLAQKGKARPKLSEEHKARISKGLTGNKRQPLSEEHKKKISDTKRLRKA